MIDGAPVPELTFTYQGFVNGEDTNVLFGSPTLSTAVTATSPAGTYPINVEVSSLSASNYSFAAITGQLTVTPASLTVAANAADKTYDGTPAATVMLTDNRLTGDNFTVSYTNAAFSDRAVGNAKTVTVSGISIAGPDAGNYTVNSTATATASITPASLTPSITVGNKTYDGTTAAIVASRSLGGVLGSDDVTLTGGIATFEDKNVGSGKNVIVTGLSLNGSDSGNYILATDTATTASITPRSLIVGALGVDKSYDGTVNATVALSDNRVSGDSLTTSYTTAAFADKNVGTSKPVTVSGISVSGTDAGNYSANTSATTTGV